MKNSVKEVELMMREHWPESISDTSLALLKVTRIQESFKKEIENCVEKFELQHADFSVLATLRRSGEPYCLSPTELYKSMFFSSGGLTKVLGRLVEAELIERIENPDDKRSKLVKLNVKGKQLVEKIIPKLHQQDRKIFKKLSMDEIKQLDALLDKVLEN